MSARKTVSPILPSIAVVLAIAGVTTLLPLPVAFTDTAHARNHKHYRSDPPPVTRSGNNPPPVIRGTATGTPPPVTRSTVAGPTTGKFGGGAIQSGARIDLGSSFEPRGPRAQHQDHRGESAPATPPRRQGN